MSVLPILFFSPGFWTTSLGLHKEREIHIGSFTLCCTGAWENRSWSALCHCLQWAEPSLSQHSYSCWGKGGAWRRQPVDTAGAPLGHHSYIPHIHSFLAQLHQHSRLLLFEEEFPSMSLSLVWKHLFLRILSKSASAMKSLECKNYVWLLA